MNSTSYDKRLVRTAHRLVILRRLYPYLELRYFFNIIFHRKINIGASSVFLREREREREREFYFFFSRNSENIQVVDTALNRALVVCEVDLV